MVLVERIDRLGRVVYTCPGCTRRKAGVCVRCPKPVYGKVGVAKYCAWHKVIAHREDHLRYRLRHLERYNKSAAIRQARKRAEERQGRPALDQKTVGRIRGLARAAALTPERRSEIAKKAARTRWQKHRQREMLKRMQEATTPIGGTNA